MVSVLLLSWEYRLAPGPMLITLLAVLVMITTTVCVAVRVDFEMERILFLPYVDVEVSTLRLKPRAWSCV
ncbi:hypothetical protein Krac_12296 [Ktedonobacter racemifer DSM 44963]|uniref:Uncharacterized protein n=1 Tax=Ktedonobacter racemifer DSM 44963 TaxID=485913 RepID=D6TGF7_KTERA|nr:hypothetical protein Krac_12296 [Ktedonobacter racemifer DSM 44963]